MKNFRIVTEEELPKLKNRYYKFGFKELKVGDKVGTIVLENESDGINNTFRFNTFIFDDDGCAYILTDKKYVNSGN